MRGIDAANDDNSCLVEQNSSRLCVLILDIMDANQTARGEISGANDIYLYWMAGATACGVVWAIVNTATLIVLSEFIRALYKVEEIKHKQRTASHRWDLYTFFFRIDS